MEVIYIDDLEPAILELQKSASCRMREQNQVPHESYDFKVPRLQGLVKEHRNNITGMLGVGTMVMSRA